LDTDFGSGATFFKFWQTWRGHPNRPAMLHYVGVLSLAEAEHLQTVLGARTDAPGPADLSATLAALCFGLLPGFHRILLEDGQLSLTLCVGERSEALARQEMQADCVLATASDQPWDKWQLKALARCCKRGTHSYFSGAPLPSPALLMDAGFAPQTDAIAPAMPHPSTLQAVYDPRWQLRSNPRGCAAPSTPAPHSTPVTLGRCAVIGAGIAGASVARALAVRGWQVDVYDGQPACAGGASGLPVGLVVPHHSADDSPRSRLSRSGTRLTLQHAGRLLQMGQDWSPGGVLELSVDENDLADAEAEVLSHAAAQQTPTGWSSRRTLGNAAGLWHPYAAWIKPALLVKQWLNHARIQFHGACQVHTLQQVQSKLREQPHWLLRNAQGAQLGRADLVIFANAYGCAEVLARMAETSSDIAWLPGMQKKLQSLQAMQGTLSMGACPQGNAGTAFPAFPVNGHGSFVSNVPDAQGSQWFAGSTFQTEPLLHADLLHEHAINRKKLQALLPEAAQLLSTQFDSGQVRAWQGTRCITHDRLPLVGPLEDAPSPTLWLCAGMGARGLSFSALCAELLAARLGGEPLPIESNLAKLLATKRMQRSKVIASEKPLTGV
jgi:tRNA 5-methylaminomethyl-2-thiouridine biosynthesis bifunctional protein